jgi:electron transfer flavoprotein alpha subunit
VILVVAEQRGGRLQRVSREAIAAARVLAGGGERIEAAVLGGHVGEAADELARTAVTTVHRVEHPALDRYTPDGYVQAVRQLVERLAPEHVMFPHTYQARDFVPKLAASLDRALVTDCIGINRRERQATFLRPVFQGKLIAEVAPEGPSAHFVTTQVGAFRSDDAAGGSEVASIVPFSVEVDAQAIRQRPEEPFQEAKQAVDLSQSERIVAVGRGIKSQEHIALAEQLATSLGAQVAASRPICDSGWLPMDRQIGSSGQTVAPKLYIALGISGAIQHVVGMKGSRTIVAINKDADAPIFEIADYGIVGDLFEVVPAMIAALGKS